MDPIKALKALSNETRLQILVWLKEPEKHFPPQEAGDVCEVGVCVSDIQEKVNLSQSTVSQYLSILQKAGLVTATRMGQWTYYKRNERNVAALADFIKTNL
jgi:DNA-binding transcriptional ArsR family regulator